MPPRHTLKNAAGYLAVVVLTAGFVVLAMQLWRADLWVPFCYGSDNLLTQVLIHGTMENGWYLTNGRLGMPLPQQMHDFPLADGLQFAILKLLACLFHDSAVALNLFALLAFPLAGLSSYWVLRRFEISPWPAVVVSVLYACAPYHFCRATTHVFLAAYYLLPLMTFVLVRIYAGRSPFIAIDPDSGRTLWRFRQRTAIGPVLVCMLTSASGVYYAFFSCFLLLMVGTKAAFRDRRGAHLISSLLLVAVITAGVGVAQVPTLAYTRTYGKNREAGARQAWEADRFGLDVAELLVPLRGHRVRFFARIHDNYATAGRQVTGEGPYVPLGLLASAGFVWLVGRFLWGRREGIIDALAYLTVCAVALGTIGGIGALFNFYVSPMIRCYERISIFIAFFALFALAMSVQHLLQRSAETRLSRVMYFPGGLAVLVLGFVDHTTPGLVPNYESWKSEYASDGDLGTRMEAALPAGTMVYQLPHVTFPEYPTVEAMADYELFRPYLHTRTLRFSYGAMRGREASRFQAEIARQPLNSAIRTLAFAGFGAIYVDRAGYADRGAAVERELSRLLGVEPLASRNERHTCFDMRHYIRELHHWHSDDWEMQRDIALHPIVLTWTDFGGEEKGKQGSTFRWCGRRGVVEIANNQARPRQAVLRMACASWPDQPLRLVIDGDLVQKELLLTKDLQPVELKLDVSQGNHLLRFTCDRPSTAAAGSKARLSFRVWNIDWHVEE
jgi:phosphoglycerol transferase